MLETKRSMKCIIDQVRFFHVFSVFLFQRSPSYGRMERSSGIYHGVQQSGFGFYFPNGKGSLWMDGRTDMNGV